MARKVNVVLVDDLDGGDATESVSFALDGSKYEIDLSEKNASKLRDALAKYVAAARKSGRAGSVGAGRTRSTRAATPTVDREQNQAIRDWAKKKGLKVSDRGRIPAEIVEQYHAQG